MIVADDDVRVLPVEDRRQPQPCIPDVGLVEDAACAFCSQPVIPEVRIASHSDPRHP